MKVSELIAVLETMPKEAEIRMMPSPIDLDAASPIVSVQLDEQLDESVVYLCEDTLTEPT